MGNRVGRAISGGAALAFQGFDQGGFLASDIGAGAQVYFDVKVEVVLTGDVRAK